MKRGPGTKKTMGWVGILCGVLLSTGVFVAGARAAVDPVTVEVHYQNGVKYFKRGLYDKSIAEFEKTLSLDPANAEAKAYLEKVKGLQTRQKPVEPAPSNDAQVRRLYDEGRQLYRERRYKEAQDVFAEVLRLKPIDDFASYYREKCEIYIGRQAAKEKKEAAHRKAMQQREDAIASKNEAKRERERARQEMLAKRAAIKEEHRRKTTEVKTEETKAEEAKKAEPATQEEKTPAVTAPVVESEREQKIAEKRKAREEKLQEKAEREARARQKKVALQEAKVLEHQKALEKKASTQEQNKARIEERQRIKELFIKGVEEYSRKDYDDAIASFRGVIDAEKKSGARYSHTALRLLNKAQLRKKGIGEDREIR